MQTLRIVILLAFLGLCGVHAQSIGTIAPDLTLLDRNQQALSLSDFAGKPIVLNFWATWCPPCRAELPIFQEISDELNAEEYTITFLLVNGGEDFEFANLYLNEASIYLPAAFNGSREMRAAASTDTLYVERTQDVLRRYLVRGMPTTYFIDADGIVRHRSFGGLNRLVIQAGLQSIGIFLPEY